MKKIINQKPKLLTILSLALILCSCQSLNISKSSNNEADLANDPSKVIVSTYSGGQVTLQEATAELNKLIAKNEKLKGLTFDSLDSDQKEIVIKEVVLNDITGKEAKKRNLQKDKDYREALQLFETELLKQKLFIALTNEAKEENNLKKNYDELAEKLKSKKDLRISYILIKTKSEAETIYQSLLKSPSSFSTQAKKKSLDKEIGKKGGDLGFVMEDILPAEVVKQAITVSKGQIAKPILSSGKWVIVKLEDERPAEITPFDKAKEALAGNLAKKAIEDFISQNLEKAQINILVK